MRVSRKQVAAPSYAIVGVLVDTVCGGKWSFSDFVGRLSMMARGAILATWPAVILMCQISGFLAMIAAVVDGQI